MAGVTVEQVISLCIEYESLYGKKIVLSTEYKDLPLGMMFKNLMKMYYKASIPVSVAKAMLGIKTVVSLVTKQPYVEDADNRIQFLKTCKEKGLNPRKQSYNGIGGQACINWLRRHYDRLNRQQQQEVDLLCKRMCDRTDELYQLVYQYESYYGPINYRTVYKGREIGRFIFRQMAKYRRNKDEILKQRLDKSVTYKQTL